MAYRHQFGGPSARLGNTMSADQVLEFCSSSCPRLSPFLSGTETTLKITVESLDPEQIMEDLGFDTDAKTWAGALYETPV